METDAKTFEAYKSKHSAKFEHSFGHVVIFTPRSPIYLACLSMRFSASKVCRIGLMLRVKNDEVLKNFKVT